jgi:hypothetical protein
VQMLRTHAEYPDLAITVTAHGVYSRQSPGSGPQRAAPQKLSFRRLMS